MAQIVRMPSVIANATEAVLSEWLKSPGETITIGDPLAEIETDKAVVEYAAEVEGTIGRLLVEPGTTVVVGDPIVVVLEAGEDLSAVSLDELGGGADSNAAAGDAPAAAPVVEAEPSPAQSRRGANDAPSGGRPEGRLFAARH
jgi:pyruvate dehydrogenase E2 component (dihydrolipoamide acetyltransferase)